MTYLSSKSPGLEIAKGNVSGHTPQLKFGENSAVGTSFIPICSGGVFPTPQVSGAKNLRIKTGGDTGDGGSPTVGATEITVVGLSTTGELIQETIATKGDAVSENTSNQFLRFLRGWVSKSERYATVAQGSHEGTITIEASDGSADWGQLNATDFARGQSTVGCYTTSLGTSAYLDYAEIAIESTKVAQIMLLQRQNILETAAPYTAMRLVGEWSGITDNYPIQFDPPKVFPPLTDIIWLAKVGASTGSISVNFHMVEVT